VHSGLFKDKASRADTIWSYLVWRIVFESSLSSGTWPFVCLDEMRGRRENVAEMCAGDESAATRIFQNWWQHDHRCTDLYDSQENQALFYDKNWFYKKLKSQGEY